MINQNQLIYNSPKCPLMVRIVIVGLPFFFLNIVGIIVLIYGLFFATRGQWIGPIAFICLLYGSILINKGFMFTHFRIYENGITGPIYHKYHPFEKCDDLKTSLGLFPNFSGKTDTIFMKWENIACFELLWVDLEKPIDKRRAPVVMIHLKEIKSNNYLLKQGFPITYDFSGMQTDKIKQVWANAIFTFIDILRKKGIPEIPRNCQNCGQQVDPPFRKCRFCNFERWQSTDKVNDTPVSPSAVD